MAKLCNACGGAVCPTCGGCSCVYDAVDERLAPFKEKAEAIEQKLEEAVVLFGPIYKDDRLAHIEDLMSDALGEIRAVIQEMLISKKEQAADIEAEKRAYDFEVMR